MTCPRKKQGGYSASAGSGCLARFSGDSSGGAASPVFARFIGDTGAMEWVRLAVPWPRAPAAAPDRPAPSPRGCTPLELTVRVTTISHDPRPRDPTSGSVQRGAVGQAFVRKLRPVRGLRRRRRACPRRPALERQKIRAANRDGRNPAVRPGAERDRRALHDPCHQTHRHLRVARRAGRQEVNLILV